MTTSSGPVARTASTMERVQRFLGLRQRLPAEVLSRVHNRNAIRKSRASRTLNETLDAFFAPHNEALYEWAASRGVPFARWENASQFFGSS